MLHRIGPMLNTHAEFLLTSNCQTLWYLTHSLISDVTLTFVWLIRQSSFKCIFKQTEFSTIMSKVVTCQKLAKVHDYNVVCIN